MGFRVLGHGFPIYWCSVSRCVGHSRRLRQDYPGDQMGSTYGGLGFLCVRAQMQRVVTC